MEETIERIKSEGRSLLLHELLRLDERDVIGRHRLGTSRISTVQQYTSISYTIEMITVEANACNIGINNIQLDRFPNLCLLRVKSNSFNLVKTVSITNMPRLEYIIVDKGSFFHGNPLYGRDYNQTTKSLTISNCPVLDTLIIGERSFVSFNQFELSNLPRLRRLEVGKKNTTDRSCFYKSSLQIKGKRTCHLDEQTCRC